MDSAHEVDVIQTLRDIMSESRQTRRGDGGAGDKRRDGGRSKVSLHTSHPRTMDRPAQGGLKDNSRPREVIGQLQAEGRGFDKEEELRWRINHLEKDKLELESKLNKEVSGYEAQLTRCRALVEKGEAQRQTLEYELAVVRRDAAAEKTRSEERTSDLIAQNQQLEGLSAELHQRASDLQRALEITQQARCDDERSLQAELRERDHVIHSISTERELLQEENTHLQTLLQGQKDTLQELKDRMDSVQRDRERDAEELRVRMTELRKSVEREERMKKDLETSVQRIKALQESVESERAAHLEVKVNAEVVQYRNTKAELIGRMERAKAASADLIGQLEQEKAESAKLIGRFEQEKAESAKLIGRLEQEKAESAKLIGQLEQEKAESAKLIGRLEQEKAESAKLSVRLQEQERVHTERGQELNLRLLTGCVLAPPQSMMGSFSWAELSVMLQEQADVLTSHLSSANQRIACLESVCEGKEAALTSVCEQLKQREQSWINQREELKTHHTHLITELQTRAQDLRSRLDHAEERLCASERSNSSLQQEVTRLQELVRVCRRDDASLLAACAMLAGCVRAFHDRVCALVRQKNVLKHRVCAAESLHQEVSALLHALGDPGVKGQGRFRGGVWKFRVCAIAALAAIRLRTLRRNTHTLFRAGAGVCVRELELSETHTEGEEDERVTKTLTSSQLCGILHTCMQEVQTELQRPERSVCVLAAARSSFTKLMEKLLPESESGCYGDVGSLARQLGQGLNNLRKTHNLPLRHDGNKVMLSALQQHFLVFTQRLHSAEVERRDLRIELSRIKRRHTHTRNETRDSTHTCCVPVQQFRSVCEELSAALHREQQVQTLLHQQAAQLQELGVTMETHTSQQLEKDHTLAQAVQSLSDAKAELKRKDQSLRSLEKRLSRSQQETQELQQSINRAENTLRMAARSKESLSSYIMSVECRLRELKDRLALSHSTTSQDDFTLHLPTMHQDTDGVQLCGRGAELKACQ
ncbi:coiled-coil domain-containing protein, partial [Clarias magur]